jgi:uncharacterized protein (TIGR02001 family)
MRRSFVVSLHGAAALLALAAHAAAAAQVSGSVALVSDYQYRGVSLSDGKPVPQLALVYDHADGWYLGTFASRLRRIYGTESGSTFISYAGYTGRLASGASWEVGVSHYAYPSSSDVNFQEVYAGLATERFSARVSYSPHYLFQGLRTVYAEMSGSRPLGDRLSLFAHVGYLGSLREGSNQWPVRRTDARVGLGISLDSWEGQLAWADAHQRGKYPEVSEGSLVLTVKRRF